MKKSLSQFSAFCILSLGLSVPGLAEEKFISSVHLSVQETNPELLMRGQRLVIEQFQNALALSPVLQNREFESRTNGNELVFLMSADNDLRAPVQDVLAEMITHLNGRVLARGKSMFYRAALSQGQDGYLEVVSDEPVRVEPIPKRGRKGESVEPLPEAPRRILAISAQSVSLRDLLKEIRNQAGNFSYLIPGECAEKLVDWSFGENVGAVPKEVDLVMSELATMFGLKSEKKNETYIFTGNCDTAPTVNKQSGEARSIRAKGFLLAPTPEFVTRKTPAAQTGAPVPTPVFLPMLPMGE